MLQLLLEKTGSCGTAERYIYFAVAYIGAECFSIPSTPLTIAAGTLFGTIKGSMLVVLSATVASCISFLVGRTILKSRLEKALEGHKLEKKFHAVNRAIGKDGFRIVLLLRVSAIFPFAIINYMYGITCVRFIPYMCASFLGFIPGALAYGWSGSQIGGDLLAAKWYTYVSAGLCILLALFAVKIISSTAKRAIHEEDFLQNDTKIE